MIEQSSERLADPLLAILDRSAVAMATGSPGWYLEQPVELLRRIARSVHIWGQLIWCCSLCSAALYPFISDSSEQAAS